MVLLLSYIRQCNSPTDLHEQVSTNLQGDKVLIKIPMFNLALERGPEYGTKEHEMRFSHCHASEIKSPLGYELLVSYW